MTTILPNHIPKANVEEPLRAVRLRIMMTVEDARLLVEDDASRAKEKQALLLDEAWPHLDSLVATAMSMDDEDRDCVLWNDVLVDVKLLEMLKPDA